MTVLHEYKIFNADVVFRDDCTLVYQFFNCFGSLFSCACQEISFLPARDLYYSLQQVAIKLYKRNFSVDELIDVIQGNRVYISCLYVYNKIDQISIQEMDRLVSYLYKV